MADTGADALSIDWRLPLSEARRRLPGKPLQGNLDPGLLLGAPEEVSRRTRAMLSETEGRAHVANLGHGVLPGSRLDCVEAFFDAVRSAAAIPAEAEIRA
jgi:uroporphyrinogen decarboxylase